MGTLHQLEIDSSIYQKILCCRTFLLWDNMPFSQMGTQEVPTFRLFGCLPDLLIDSIQVAHTILVKTFCIHLHQQLLLGKGAAQCLYLFTKMSRGITEVKLQNWTTEVYARCIWGWVGRGVTSVYLWSGLCIEHPLAPAFLDSLFQLSFIWNKFS